VKTRDERTTLLDMLTSNVIFSQTTAEQREALVEQMFQVRAEPGAVLIRQDAPSGPRDCFYFVVSGEFIVIRRDVREPIKRPHQQQQQQQPADEKSVRGGGGGGGQPMGGAGGGEQPMGGAAAAGGQVSPRLVFAQPG
jgi:spore coat protein CotH